MPGRILTLQRQARELGRLRAGTFEQPSGGRGRPTRSKTWILTSHQREYLDAAAEQWGGDVHEWTPQGNGAKAWRVITDSPSIDAILPPGDPLSQHYEMWSRGGCQRRCDGEVEHLSAKPCLCLAEFGEEFHLQDPDKACRPHTRLSVILPDIPDLGVWRMESKGFYAANEIAASIDLIRQATGGQVMVPIRLRIEPRKRVAQGKTKQYPVIVVEIRGATAGQILSGSAPVAAISGNGNGGQPAIEAGPPKLTAERVLEIAGKCKSIGQIQRLWREAADDGVLSDELAAKLKAIGDGLMPARPVSSPPASNGQAATVPPQSSGQEPNPDAMFAAIMSAAPADWGTAGVQQRIEVWAGKPLDEVDGWGLEKFLTTLTNGEVQ